MKQLQFILNADEVLALNAHLTQLFQDYEPEDTYHKMVFACLHEIQKKLHNLSFTRKAKNKLVMSATQSLGLLIAYRKWLVTDIYCGNTLIQITTKIDQKI